MKQLKKYQTTPFMAKDSTYDKTLADHAVAFIQCLNHTKGVWAGNLHTYHLATKPTPLHRGSGAHHSAYSNNTSVKSHQARRFAHKSV